MAEMDAVLSTPTFYGGGKSGSDFDQFVKMMTTPYENTEHFLNTRGTDERLGAGPGGVMANPFRGQAASAVTRLLDTVITGRGAARADDLEQRLGTIKDLLVDVRNDPTYVAAELRNVARMRDGELGWIGKVFAAPQVVDGVQTPSQIEAAVGSVLNRDALTFGSIMAPLTNPFAMRSNSNAMGGMLAMLSLADPDLVVSNLRSMANAQVIAPGGEQMYAFDFASRRDTAAGLLTFLGTGPAMAAGNATRSLVESSLNRATGAVQSALSGLRIPDIRQNPFAPELSRGAPIPPLRDSPNSPLEPFNRRAHYGNTPTLVDRRVFGVGPDEVVDHSPSLVRRYYEGDPATGELPGWQMNDAQRRASANDRNRMSPQPRSESNVQGAESANYSKQMKKMYGL